jgi:transposase
VKGFGVPKQTVSRWMGRWEAEGLPAPFGFSGA